MKRAALLVVFLGFGCGPDHDLTPIEHQDKIANIVWHDVYGRTDTPPAIDWRMGTELDCGGGQAFFFEGTGKENCYSGLHIPGADFAIVAKPLDTPVHRTAYAHELLHIRKERMGLDPDTQHVTPDFQAGGALNKANAALLGAGY